MNCKKVTFTCTSFSLVFIIIIYMVYFNHPPPEKILEANTRNNPYLDRVLKGDGDEDVLRSARAWQKFVTDNKLVAIGDIYDKCDEEERKWLGVTVILPDTTYGGVTSKTYINVTFEEELAGGDFFLSVKYRGSHLYENQWQFCEMQDDEDDEDRWIFCPYKPGSYSWVINQKIPDYLPKGTYSAQAWLKDENENEIMCGFGEFVL